MSLTVRIVFFCIVGLCAGLMAWPLAETIVFFQGVFPSLFLYSTALGAVIGLVIGMCFGLVEGITSHSRPKLLSGALTGLIVGIIGGVLGFLAGQAAGLFIGTAVFYSNASMQNFGYPIAKALGWALLGVFVGIVEGVRSKSGAKIINGILGGLLGGFLGGLAFEYSMKLLSQNVLYARLLGMAILGIFIGLFYGLVENRLAKAKLYVLNGTQKGREVLLNQREFTVGLDDQADMSLDGYRGIAPEHLIIKRRKNEIILTDKKSATGTFVNDKKVTESALSDGDVIRVGDAQFLFKQK